MKMLQPKAIIVGVNGQDGRLLFSHLSSLGYQIVGLDRNTVKTAGQKWTKKTNIAKPDEVSALIKKIKPQEVYYLAAWHHAAQDKTADLALELRQSLSVNVDSLTNFLEAIRRHSPRTRLFYASSALIFGRDQKQKQTESSPYRPDSIYGLTKLGGTLLCRLYRERYGLFAAVGIMYNHESIYRPDNFVSLKIIKGALKIKNKIKNGAVKKIIVGDLQSWVDWGYAPDYVQAMRRILKLKHASDFIIATGESHRVLDFIKVTFKSLGLDWRTFIQEDKKLIAARPSQLRANPQKLQAATKWRPSLSFEGMIKRIISDLNNN